MRISSRRTVISDGKPLWFWVIDLIKSSITWSLVLAEETSGFNVRGGAARSESGTP
jgi:hypothetical protein